MGLFSILRWLFGTDPQAKSYRAKFKEFKHAHHIHLAALKGKKQGAIDHTHAKLITLKNRFLQEAKKDCPRYYNRLLNKLHVPEHKAAEKAVKLRQSEEEQTEKIREALMKGKAAPPKKKRRVAHSK